MLVEYAYVIQGCRVSIAEVDLPREAIPDAGDILTLHEGEKVFFKGGMVIGKSFDYDLATNVMVCRITVQDPQELHAQEACALDEDEEV